MIISFQTKRYNRTTEISKRLIYILIIFFIDPWKIILAREPKSYAGAPDNLPRCCTSERNCMWQSSLEQPWDSSLKRSMRTVGDKAICIVVLHILCGS